MSKGKLLAVCVVWLLLLGVGVLVWRLAFAPRRQAEQERQQEEQQQRDERERLVRMKKGGTSSRYRDQVSFSLDSFSGYAVLRSQEFKRQLGDRDIRLVLHDDGADYLARIKALQSGDADMAVFTIDALVKVCAQVNELPATIVAFVDETTGADAIVAYKQAVPDLDALNRAETRFVLTPNSPSETLARAVMSRFALDQLSPHPFEEVDDAQAVFGRYRSGKASDPVAYVLWEPFVSQILKNPETHVLVDSAGFPSTIVDVIVAADDFWIKNPKVVKDLVECYLRSLHQYRERDAMVRLVMDDAAESGSPLSAEQAEKLVDGIWWKNTQENLAHMGFLPGKPLPHVEDMIANIIDVLATTGGLQADPTEGNASYLYTPDVLAELKAFHPGEVPEQIRSIRLPALDEEQWKRLVPVGTARVPSLVFAPATDRLNPSSQLVLDDLAAKLSSTRFYVLIQGNASRRGDPKKNQDLAARRAKVAEQYLIAKGVDRNRLRSFGGEPSGARSVSFVLQQKPY